MKRTSTSIQLAFGGCVLLLCRNALCCGVFVLWRGRTGETITIPDCCAPPILTWSLVVTSLFSRVCDVCVPSVLCFLLWSTKKRSAALLSGAYRLVQGYRPRFLQSLINVYAVYFERSTLCLLARFHCSSAEPLTIKKKKNAPYILVSCIFLYIWVLGDPTFLATRRQKKTLRAGRGTFNTCAKYQGLLSLKNGVYIWTFVR